MNTNPAAMAIINSYDTSYWATDVVTAERPVLRLVKADLNSNQFSALVSLVVNIGVGEFKRSGVPELLNRGKPLAALVELQRYDLLDGKVHRPYVKCRKEERLLFLTPYLVSQRITND